MTTGMPPTSTSATVLLMCGLPGSGKSTLVQRLSISSMHYERTEVIDYDHIAAEIEQSKATETQQSHQPPQEQIIFSSHDLEAWRQSRIHALHKLKDTLQSHFTSDVFTNTSLLVIMDDNFHLKSMRREIFRACQEVLADHNSTIGFVTLYVSTPLEVCLEQNKQREGKQRVPDSVIQKMAAAIEPPDPSKPYGSFEKFYLTIDNHGRTADEVLEQIQKCLKESLSSPIPLKNEVSAEEAAQLESERARQREDTLKCELQRIDQLLRKLVGAVGRIDKSKTKLANEARKQILDRSKRDGIGSDDRLVHDFTSLIEIDAYSTDGVDSQLVTSIAKTFDAFTMNP